MCRMATPWKHPKTGIYHIRVAIPEKLREHLPGDWKGKREYKRPLIDPQTGERARTPVDAKRLFVEAMAEWMALRGIAEARTNDAEPDRLSDRQIAWICAQWLQEALHDDDSIPTGPGLVACDEIESQCQDFLVFVSEHRLPVREWTQYPFVPDTADRLIVKHGLTAPTHSLTYRRLCEAVARYGLDLAKKLRDRLDGDWTLPVSVTNSPKVEDGQVNGTPDMPTILGLLGRWEVETNPNQRQIMEFSGAVNEFVELVGNLSIQEVTTTHVREYKDALLGRGLHARTVDKRIGVLRRLYGTAADNGYVERDFNPTSRIKVRGVKKAGRKRSSYTIDELNKLFAGPVHKDGKRYDGGKGEAQYWLPLLGLFTGARLEDLAQLRVEDVKLDAQGIYYLDINDRHGKQVKNRFTLRRVPVHSTLIDLGFLKYVEVLKTETEETWLFPDVDSYRGQVAKAWGQWFGRYRRQVLQADPVGYRKDFHSFRHNFRDAGRAAGVQTEILDALEGHRPASVGQGYGEGYRSQSFLRDEMMKRLKDAIEQIVYPNLVIPSP